MAPARATTGAPTLPPLRALCVEAKLSDDAMALLDDRIEARAFLQLLMDRSQPAEADEAPVAVEADQDGDEPPDETAESGDGSDAEEDEPATAQPVAEAPEPLTLQPDAVRLLAHALPVREAVWWAWVSARREAGDAPPPAVTAALAAAETWIAQPTDENRRAALRLGQDDAGSAPSNLVALAAGLSGGSLAPAELPEVPSPAYSAAKAIGGAIIIAAVKDPSAAAERYAAFVAQGLEVADRVKLWQRFPPASRGN